MSLFGDEDRPASKSKSSLFDDDDEQSAKPNRGSGLFADSGNDEGDSPWNFVTPKKQARGNLVKTLLPASDVPESYIDAWDALLASGEISGGVASLETFKTLLTSSGLDQEQQASTLTTLTPSGATSFGRGEFNVLLALIGLAQEGEEATLDGVDDRRRRLPEPNLPHVKEAKAATSAAAAEASLKHTQSTQPVTAHENTSPANKSQAPSGQSYSFGESDPWGSPSNNRRSTQQSSGPKNKQANMFGDESTPSRDSDARFSRAETAYSATGAEDASIPPAQRPETDPGSISNAWGTYNGAGGLGGDGFGGAALEDASSAQPKQRAVPPRQFRGAEEVLTVTALADKEGPFLFQHRNYELISSRKSTKVIRRYSDFVWLLDCLYKKYPFRQLPLLPPKRVSINGNPMAADTSFIEKRRKGLSRFANALIRHPILREEQLVTMFLTVPTELAAWRKQAAITVVEEFTGKPLPPTLEDSLPATLEDLFADVRGGVVRSSEHYMSLCGLVERMIRRRDGIAVEYSRMATLLEGLTEASAETYKFDTNDVPMLNEGLKATAKHAQKQQSLLDEESRAWDENVLEDIKSQRDTLVSMRELFERKDRLARDDIPKLEKRIASNESKLIAVRNKPEQTRKAGDAEKLEEAIMRDKESIVAQHARGVFIRECVRDEISYFQASQYHVSKMCQDWSQERVKYVEQTSDNWSRWADAVENMPLGE